MRGIRRRAAVATGTTARARSRPSRCRRGPGSGCGARARGGERGVGPRAAGQFSTCGSSVESTRSTYAASTSGVHVPLEVAISRPRHPPAHRAPAEAESRRRRPLRGAARVDRGGLSDHDGRPRRKQPRCCLRTGQGHIAHAVAQMNDRHPVQPLIRPAERLAEGHVDLHSRPGAVAEAQPCLTAASGRRPPAAAGRTAGSA